MTDPWAGAIGTALDQSPVRSPPALPCSLRTCKKASSKVSGLSQKERKEVGA